MQDLNDFITGSTLTAAQFNEIPSEIQNVIEGLGITLSAGDLNQLGKAIAGSVANGTFYTDSGIADAYVLTGIGSKQPPQDYTDGFEAEFIVGNTNAGASTVIVAGIGVVDIAGTSTAGTITTGDMVRMRFNLATGDFDIVSNAVAVATQAETDAGVIDTKFVSPLKMRFGFSILLASNGYLVFPSWLGGLIIQWGDAATVAGAVAVSFPLVFPNAAYQAALSDSAGSSPVISIVASGNLVQAGMDLFAADFDGAAADTLVRWIAIGN